MTTLTQTSEIVNFRNQPLVTLKVGEIIYTAIRPIVEGMGLDWGTQQQKLRKNSEKFSCRDMPTTGKDGKIYEMLCIPIKKLNGWLFSINPEKVKAEIRDIVIAYQEECFEVLHDYWHKGEAINPRFEKISEKQAFLLQEAVKKRCKTIDKHYQTVWTAIKNRFQVTSYKNILAKDFDNALNLVWTISLPNYIEQPTEPTSPRETNEVKQFWKFVGQHQYEETSKLLRNLKATLRLAETQLNQINNTRSLVSDALTEPKHSVGSQTEEIYQQALAFIQRQNAMKA